MYRRMQFVGIIAVSACVSQALEDSTFVALDRNANGELSLQEFELLINDPGQTHDPATPQYVRKQFVLADFNGDGSLSASELTVYLK
ncbi:hypothetical protein BWR17_19085 (plasmid) [Phaeobacter inhibens]|uniref:hypothetical protein n=1 Tax=Phaeobacter inhibens TaxID=221822 RepID=UPI0009717CC7|nr:hypothetical protein [Phaeobacter inhibens]APX17997.1 hypothetical protein BWR17_19085 [Phaeobacter inhibens]